MVDLDANGTTDAPDWFSQALAAPVRVGAVPVDGVAIAYRLWGGPGLRPIVLVHGGGAHSRWWDHVAPLLALNRQVVAFDLSGHGDSARRESYGLEIWKHEVIGVARGIGLAEPPIVIGHSMGGFVALHAASSYGSLIDGVMTIDSPVLDVAPEERAARAGFAFGPLRVFPTRDAARQRFHPVPDQPTLPYVADHVAECSIREAEGGWTWKFDPRVFQNQHMPPALRPLSGRLAQFRAEYGIHPDEPTEAVIDGHGRPGQIIEIPAAGHHVMLDQPIALVTGIRSLLAEWDPAGAGQGA
jgi:pimeloyl-ACP methyl ester carboxylesterase